MPQDFKPSGSRDPAERLAVAAEFIAGEVAGMRRDLNRLVTKIDQIGHRANLLPVKNGSHHRPRNEEYDWSQ